MTLTKSLRPLTRSNAAYDSTLQLHWFGTSCHLLQLGDVTLLTDPFFTVHSALTVGFGSIQSDPAQVEAHLGDRRAVRAIFVGHSHYDHMLDLAATLERPGWQDVPVFGSMTTRNLLHGYGKSVAAHWRPACTSGRWQDVGRDGRLAYQAIESKHAPQLPGVFLYGGKVEEPLEKPPHHAGEFKVGQTYAYLFRLSDPTGNEKLTHTVYFSGAAASPPFGFPGKSATPVDVAILCVPGWRHVSDYPECIIAHLRPRHIVLSHFDNFLEPRRDKRTVVPTADLDVFLRKVQAITRYARFESIVVPDVGAVLQFRKTPATP